jgi:hypothetical protein
MTPVAAIHEAAHAVVAEQVGIRVEHVEIGRRLVDAGDGPVAVKGYVVFGARCASDFEVAVSYAAGPVAEERVTGILRRDRTPGADFVEVDWFTFGDPEVEQFVIEAARASVASNWQMITRVADALAAHGAISGHDVRRIIGEVAANPRTSKKSARTNALSGGCVPVIARLSQDPRP